jgi:iron complex transport system ATP-binding protein
MSAIVVTHELNLAAEYADRVLLLKSGRVVALGPPKDVITRENLRAVFETPLLVDENPVSGAPRVTPIRT